MFYYDVWWHVTYLNMSRLKSNYDALIDKVKQTGTICHQLEVLVNYTCKQDLEIQHKQLERINEWRDIIQQLSQDKANRIKRGWMNIGGTIAKILFRISDQDDAEIYLESISQLENEHASMLKVAREQMTVVRSTLQSVNSTFFDVTKNGRQISNN